LKASRKLFETAVRIFIRIGRKKIIDVSLPRGSSVSWVVTQMIHISTVGRTEPGVESSDCFELMRDDQLSSRVNASDLFDFVYYCCFALEKM